MSGRDLASMTREEKIEALRASRAQKVEAAPVPLTREEKIVKLKEARLGRENTPSTAPEAALQGFGNGLSMGYMPQLQALAEKPLAKVYDAVTGSKIADTVDDDYVTRRDSWAKRQQGLVEKNPGTTAAAGLAGGVVSGIATGPLIGGFSKVKNAATAAGKIGQAALAGSKSGILMGAAQNPGDVEGELSPLQIPGRIENASFGATIGGAIPVGFAGLQATGVGAVKLAQAVKSGAVKGADQIMDAARKLGVKLTPGMTSDSMAIRGLESSLEQSPTIGGALMRKEVEPLRAGVKSAVEGFTEGKTSLEPDQIGRQIKEGIVSKVDERLKPSREAFDSIRESTQTIAPNAKSINRVSDNILKIPEVRLDVGGGVGSKSNGVIARLKEAKSIDDLKVIRTQVGKMVREAEKNNPSEFAALSKIYDKLGNLEESNLLRGGVEQARAGGVPKSMADNEARKLVSELKGAKKSYSTEAQNLRSFANESKLPSSAGKSPSLFTAAVDDIQNEKVVRDLFDTGNVEALKSFEKQFPKEFGLARSSYLADLAKKAEFKGSASGNKFLEAIKSMQPSVRKMIFGGKGAEKVDALKTLTDAMPERVGPSGTSQAQEMRQSWNPMQQASGLANYVGYKAITSPKAQQVISKTEAIAKLVASSPTLKKLSESNPTAFNALATRMFAGNKFKEQEDDPGVEKWLQSQR